MAIDDEFLKKIKEKMTKGLAETLDVEESAITVDQLNAQAKKGWCPLSKNKLFCTNCGAGIPSAEGKPRHKECTNCLVKFPA